jgi:uncharacterized protein (TIGR02147 family)
MIFAHSDYRSYLRGVLAERVSRNPLYSLRSMAKHFQVSPSLLSDVLRGRKGLSIKTSLKVARKLELDPRETEYLGLLVQHEKAETKVDREAVLQRIQAFRQNENKRDLSLDAFRMIADWYHIPILEMTGLDRFKFTPRAIAQRLGITEVEAHAAIERLERLELLEKKEGGGWKKTHFRGIFQSQAANSALKHLHRQMLERAITALETQTNQEKFVGSETFCIDIAQLPEARTRIESFFDEMVRLFGEGKRFSETYHLGVQLFKLTSGGRLS